jgi:hypothetical protein
LDIFLDFRSDIFLSVWTLFDSSLDRVEWDLSPTITNFEYNSG